MAKAVRKETMKAPMFDRVMLAVGRDKPPAKHQLTYDGKYYEHPCPLCDLWGSMHDKKTGYCLDCWRAAVLTPWGAAELRRG